MELGEISRHGADDVDALLRDGVIPPLISLLNSCAPDMLHATASEFINYSNRLINHQITIPSHISIPKLIMELASKIDTPLPSDFRTSDPKRAIHLAMYMLMGVCVHATNPPTLTDFIKSGIVETDLFPTIFDVNVLVNSATIANRVEVFISRLVTLEDIKNHGGDSFIRFNPFDFNQKTDPRAIPLEKIKPFIVFLFRAIQQGTLIITESSKSIGMMLNPQHRATRAALIATTMGLWRSLMNVIMNLDAIIFAHGTEIASRGAEMVLDLPGFIQAAATPLQYNILCQIQVYSFQYLLNRSYNISRQKIDKYVKQFYDAGFGAYLKRVKSPDFFDLAPSNDWKSGLLDLGDLVQSSLSAFELYCTYRLPDHFFEHPEMFEVPGNVLNLPHSSTTLSPERIIGRTLDYLVPALRNMSPEELTFAYTAIGNAAWPLKFLPRYVHVNAVSVFIPQIFAALSQALRDKDDGDLTLQQSHPLFNLVKAWVQDPKIMTNPQLEQFSPLVKLMQYHIQGESPSQPTQPQDPQQQPMGIGTKGKKKKLPPPLLKPLVPKKTADVAAKGEGDNVTAQEGGNDNVNEVGKSPGGSTNPQTPE